MIVFAEVGWRRGLGAMKPRSGIGQQRKGPGGRRRRKRGAGGRSRCVRWPRRALFGCAALKSAHPTSRQTVSAEVAENKPKSDLAVVFLDRIAVDTSKERVRRVRLDGDHLVGPVVELEEQNAIELVPAPLVSSHTCKETFGGFVRRGRMRNSECRTSELSYWRAGSIHGLGRAMGLALARSRERPIELTREHAREFGEFSPQVLYEHDADRIRVRLGERDVVRLSPITW